MSSEKLLESRLPCVDTENCGSSDGLHAYEDGLFCFVCSNMWGPGTPEFDDYMGEKTFDTEDTEIIRKPSSPTRTQQKPKSSIKKGQFPYDTARIVSWTDRKISTPVMEFFGVRTHLNEVAFPYHYENNIIGYKIKKTDVKSFRCEGQVNGLWGQKHFPAKGRKLIITEGELDALSVAEANYKKYKKIYPVVSMGSASNDKVLIDNLDYIRQFEEVHLWLDNDQVGSRALNKAIKIIGYHKVRIVKSPYKDANQALMNGGTDVVHQAIWNSVEISPGNIVKGSETWELYKKSKNMVVIPWPPFLRRLNDKIYGRWLNSITIMCAGTGVGKSTFLKEDIYHLLTTTEMKIGVCFLEEAIGGTVSDLISIHLNKRVGLPDTVVSEDEEREAWEAVFGDDRILMLDHQGSVSDGSLIDKLEYMIHQGCQCVILDHVTIAVSEDPAATHSNQALDSFMSSLLKLVTKHPVWIGVVSHLRKVGTNQQTFESGGEITEDDMKGSGSLKQISFQTLAISRNKGADDDQERNTSKIYVLKDRKTGQTGPAGSYAYNTVTGRLYDPEDAEIGQFEIETFEDDDDGGTDENKEVTEESS